MIELEKLLEEKKVKLLSNKLTKEEIVNHINEKEELTGLSLSDIRFGEGYERSSDSLVPKFGVRWNEMISYQAYYHEVSHAIDMIEESQDRLLLPFYGLGVKTKVEVNGQYYDQPITTQATERECKVNAIQAKLMAHIFEVDEKIMLEEVIKESADALYLMHDFIYIETPDYIEDYKEKENYRKEWIRDKVREYHSELNIKDIMKNLKEAQNIRNIENWELDNILELGYHETDTYMLNQICDPFSCWVDQENPITKKEVMECLKKGEEELVHHLENELFSRKLTEEEILENRKNHIKKIAYFVKNENTKPILIDVGIPEMGAYVDYKIVDGNHRFAGNIIAGRERTKAHIIGSIEYAEELYLSAPNIYLEIYNEKVKEEISQKYNEKIEEFFEEIKNNELIENKNDILKIKINKAQFNLFANIQDNYLYKKKDEELNEKEKVMSNIRVDYSKSTELSLEMNKSDNYVFENKSTKVNEKNQKKLKK